MKDLEIGKELCEMAIRHGADHAEAYITSGTINEIRVNNQELELTRTLSNRGVALRVIKGKCMGMATTTMFEKDDLARLVDSSLEIAGIAEPDPYIRLYPQGDEYEKIETFSPGIWSMSLEEKTALLMDIEKAGKSYDTRIKRTDYVTYIDSIMDISIANSLGLALNYRESDCFVMAEFIAEEGDSAFASFVECCSRNPENFDPREIGISGAKKALLSLNGKPAKTGKYPVLFTPEAAVHILIYLGQAINGKAAALHHSFLWDKKGEKIASPIVTLVDDGLASCYTGSAPFDDEGVPVKTETIIDSGVLTDFQYDLHSATKYNHRPTGNGRRDSYRDAPSIQHNNLVLKPGNESREKIIGNISKGLYINNGMGFAGNPSTGDFSLAASGALIENGQITSPVVGVTLAGNLLDMLKAVTAIGNDLIEVHGGIVIPSILIEDVTVGGS